MLPWVRVYKMVQSECNLHQYPKNLENLSISRHSKIQLTAWLSLYPHHSKPSRSLELSLAELGFLSGFVVLVAVQIVFTCGK